MTAPLVLASSSPRRASLLATLGIAFDVAAAELDEDGETARLVAAGAVPSAIAIALATGKARAVAARRPEARVLGADTLVVLDGELLGKPRDADDARAMLVRLSGRTHEVVTGVALAFPCGAIRAGFESTAVTFDRWPAGALAAYLASGEPFDKAGAYGIQGAAGAYVARVDGCFFNVVGLPLARVRRLLAADSPPPE